jgi:phage-related protein
MSPKDKPIVWLHGEVKSPPFSAAARIEAGYLLRAIQSGLMISMPHSRPMPTIGPRCHELRIADGTKIWRIVHRLDLDAVVIADVFVKKTNKTPNMIIKNSKRRFSKYDNESD